MEAAIIGVLGTGLLGMLGFFLQAIRSDIRALSTRLDRHEEILGDMRERLARMEATQAEHSRMLAEHSRALAEHSRLLVEHGYLLGQMVGRGERIAAIEGTEAAG